MNNLPVDEEGALIESENMEGGREEVQHVASPVRQFGMGTFAAVLMLTGATFAFVTIITNGVSARSSGEDKPRNLEITTAAEAGLALSAETAGKPWSEVESIYSQEQSGVATDPAVVDTVSYANAHPGIFANAISASNNAAGFTSSPWAGSNWTDANASTRSLMFKSSPWALSLADKSSNWTVAERSTRSLTKSSPWALSLAGESSNYGK
jgi:hypothetical protein